MPRHILLFQKIILSPIKTENAKRLSFVKIILSFDEQTRSQNKY